MKKEATKKVSTKQKNKLAQKLQNFEKKGLEKYLKYLESQLESAKKSDGKKAYKKYLKTQIAQTTKKIKKIG